jgi:membrane dipeptidase
MVAHMIIVDAHEDLAYNTLSFGRDYTLSALETRRREQGSSIPKHNGGEALLGYPEYRRGRVAVIFSTLFAAPQRANGGEWDKVTYTTPQQAYELYSAQVDLYDRLVEEHADKFRLILTRADLESVLALWESLPEVNDHERDLAVGLVISMEGAEGVRSIGELEEWWQRGVRLIGPAWSGNRYTGGTHEPGPLTKEGFALLEGMADLGFGLDLSHMDEKAALQALDAYPGTILASHANARSLIKSVEGNRHLTDGVIRGLIERDGVIGIVPFNKFLDYSWTPEEGKDKITLQHVVAQIDYICQLAGDAHHVGLGTDFDGGFGREAVPSEIDTIADLPKLSAWLAEKGYSQADIAAVMGANWLSILRRVLPEGT